MAVHFHPHARERMDERNVTEDEVNATIERGEKFPAKFGRTGFRTEFPFTGKWRGKSYKANKLKPMQFKRRGSGELNMKFTYDPRHNIAYIRFLEKERKLRQSGSAMN